MHGSPLTDHEKEVIISHASTHTIEEIADILSARYKRVHYFAKKLGVYKSNYFTEQEKEFIRENHKAIPDDELATKLNRSINSIRSFKCRNNLTQKRKRNDYYSCY